jgi:putative ABC transport system substrate-binding protein
MRLIGLAVVLALSLVLAPHAVEAQKPEKTARLGVLYVGLPQSPEQLAKSAGGSALFQSMKALGWVEGRNLAVEWRSGESAEQLQAAAADLVQQKVDVFFVCCAALAKIVQLETKTIPIVVYAAGADLVAAGLVSSLARPGGNLTGLQILGDDLIPKRLELLKALIPNLSRVAFVQEDATLSTLPQVLARYDQQATVAARSLRIELHTFILHREGDVPTAFLGIVKKSRPGSIGHGDFLCVRASKEIIDLAATHRITAVYENQLYVESGGLMSYGVSIPEMRRRGAVYVDISKHVGRVNSEPIVVDEIVA